MLNVWELIVNHVPNRLAIAAHVSKVILSRILIVCLVQISFLNVKFAQEIINTLQYYVLYAVMDILY